MAEIQTDSDNDIDDMDSDRHITCQQSVSNVSNTNEEHSVEELEKQLKLTISALKHAESSFKNSLKVKENTLKSVKKQLLEAQELESKLKNDLKKVGKDIEVLEKRNMEIRNEITAETSQFQSMKDNSEREISDCRTQLLKHANSPSKAVEESMSLESELECPVCTEICLPPIYQCPEGHIICSTCRPQLDRCPVCRFQLQGLPEIRNRLLEKLASPYFVNRDK